MMLLEQLARELREEGTVISPWIAADAAIGGQPGLGALVARGSRTASDRDGYAAVVECVREGYLLHYGEPRIVLCADDPDLALLAGDYLYAKGLERLAGLGDLEAVRELSDLISLTAQLNAAGTESGGWDAAAAAWLAAAVAIAAGGGPAHRRAKATLRVSGDPRPLWEAARETAAASGLGEPLASAAEAIGFRAPDRG